MSEQKFLLHSTHSNPQFGSVSRGLNQPFDLRRWLSGAEVKNQLLLCAEACVKELRADTSLRVPRNEESRKSGFSPWLLGWLEKLRPTMLDQLRNHFPEIISSLTPDDIDVLEYHIWPALQAELLSYAVRGLTNAWISRNMGDATIVGEPERNEDHWIVPLRLRGHGQVVGYIVLDSDGNIVQERSSSRQDVLKQVNG